MADLQGKSRIELLAVLKDLYPASHPRRNWTEERLVEEIGKWRALRAADEADTDEIEEGFDAVDVAAENENNEEFEVIVPNDPLLTLRNRIEQDDLTPERWLPDGLTKRLLDKYSPYLYRLPPEQMKELFDTVVLTDAQVLAPKVQDDLYQKLSASNKDSIKFLHRQNICVDVLHSILALTLQRVENEIDSIDEPLKSYVFNGIVDALRVTATIGSNNCDKEEHISHSRFQRIQFTVASRRQKKRTEKPHLDEYKPLSVEELAEIGKSHATLDQLCRNPRGRGRGRGNNRGDRGRGRGRGDRGRGRGDRGRGKPDKGKGAAAADF